MVRALIWYSLLGLVQSIREKMDCTFIYCICQVGWDKGTQASLTSGKGADECSQHCEKGSDLPEGSRCRNLRGLLPKEPHS